MEKKVLYSFIIGILAIAFFTSQCKKEEKPLPFAVVNISIEPNSTQFIRLNTVGGYEYLTANPPSRGLIVYRISVDKFMAFERTCPHDPDACCDVETGCSRVKVEEDGIILKDSCCGSTFLILDGSNVTGPAVRPLKQYNTSYNGRILHIYN